MLLLHHQQCKSLYVVFSHPRLWVVISHGFCCRLRAMVEFLSFLFLRIHSMNFALFCFHLGPRRHHSKAWIVAQEVGLWRVCERCDPNTLARGELRKWKYIDVLFAGVIPMSYPYGTNRARPTCANRGHMWENRKRNFSQKSRVIIHAPWISTVYI